MDNEDEFDAHFRRAAERAPVKQLSQQYSPTARTPTTSTRRASLQAPDAMYSTQSGISSKRSSPSPSHEVLYESPRTSTTPTSPNPRVPRRRSQKSRSEDTERQRESSSAAAAASTTSAWLARHFDHAHSTGSRSRRHHRLPLTSLVSSPADVTTPQSETQSPLVGPKTTRHGRRATLAGDLLQIPPTLDAHQEVDRRSSSVSPPSRSPTPSRSPSTRQRSGRRKLESSQVAWATTSTDREMPRQAAEYRKDMTVSNRGHVVRTFALSARGIVNVENAVRSDNVYFDDDDDEGKRSGRAQRPTTLRHANAGRRISATAEHSRRMSPQRVLAAAAALCDEMYAEQASRRCRSEHVPPETPEYKVLVVGDHGVGKTELIRHFTLSQSSNFTQAGHHHRIFSSAGYSL